MEVALPSIAKAYSPLSLASKLIIEQPFMLKRQEIEVLANLRSFPIELRANWTFGCLCVGKQDERDSTTLCIIYIYIYTPEDFARINYSDPGSDLKRK